MHGSHDKPSLTSSSWSRKRVENLSFASAASMGRPVPSRHSARILSTMKSLTHAFRCGMSTVARNDDSIASRSCCDKFLAELVSMQPIPCRFFLSAVTGADRLSSEIASNARPRVCAFIAGSQMGRADALGLVFGRQSAH
eukprot:355617-Chlamydomonas_euryale.AAC.14